jgi:hypothetical protein
MKLSVLNVGVFGAVLLSCAAQANEDTQNDSLTCISEIFLNPVVTVKTHKMTQDSFNGPQTVESSVSVDIAVYNQNEDVAPIPVQYSGKDLPAKTVLDLSSLSYSGVKAGGAYKFHFQQANATIDFTSTDLKQESLYNPIGGEYILAFGLVGKLHMQATAQGQTFTYDDEVQCQGIQAYVSVLTGLSPVNGNQ